MFGLNFGTGFGRMGAGSRAGGTPTPPFAFPEDEMLLGMGLASVNSFQGYYPFADVLKNAGRWTKVSGAAVWSQEWGDITHPNADGATDRYRAIFTEGTSFAALPTGTYTVMNPSGNKIGVGAISDQSLAAFTTATEFTFVNPGGMLIALHAEGPVSSASGPMRIIMPGLRDAVLAGNEWNPQFLDFQEPLGSKLARFMDWVQTYYDLSEDPTDIPTGIPSMLQAPHTGLRQKVPYSLIIDLCNRLGIDPWINIPARATDAYALAVANLFATDLSPSLRVWLEYGNETWNPGDAFNDGRSWVEHLFNTRYEATANQGINGWTRTAHGLTTGNLVAQFFTRENFKYDRITVHPSGHGSLLYVEVIDTDNFKLRRWSGSEGSPVMGAVENVVTGMEKLVYKKHTVDGPGLVDVNVNHGIRTKQIWDIFNGVLGRNRCVHVMGTQLVNSSFTNARLNAGGARASTDMVGVAVYYHGDWWGAQLDIASGQVTPKAWSQRGGSAVRVGIYASGSTPTKAEVLAGSGTGYIGHRDIAIAASNAVTFTAASAITGLTNGLTYERRAVLTDPDGYTWMASSTFVASATPSTVTFTDSHDNMAMRARKNINYWLAFLETQRTAAAGIAIGNYESSHDYFARPGSDTPAAMQTIRADWLASAEHAAVFAELYHSMAAHGMKMAPQFVDVNAEGTFNLALSLTDLTNPIRLAFEALGDAVSETVPLSVANVLAPDIATEPTFPFVVHTFADPTLGYQIYNDDGKGNYEIVGDELRMIADAGVDWGVPTTIPVTIEASNGVTSDTFTVTFSTGSAWYASDAKFAWSALVDTDAAAIDPQIGSQLPVIEGTAASISGGLLTFDGTKRYGAVTPMSAFTSGRPFFIAIVLDKNSENTASKRHVQLGGGNNIQLSNDFTTPARIRFSGFLGGSLPNLYTTTGNTPAGKQVHWFFSDGTNVRVGMNQVENTAVATATALPAAERPLYVGGTNVAGATLSASKIGGVQIVERVGMTITDVLAEVAKMEAHIA